MKRFATALEFADALKGALTAPLPVASPTASQPADIALRDTELPFDEPRAIHGFAVREFDAPEPEIDLRLHEEKADALPIVPPAPPVAKPPPRPSRVAAVAAPVSRPRASVTPATARASFDAGAASGAPGSAPASASVSVPSAPVTEPARVDVERPRDAARPHARSVPAQMLDLKSPPAPAPEPFVSRTPTAFVDQSTDEFRESALEKTRSAVWPLVLAMGVGLVVGFAGGYGVAMRDRLISPAPTQADVSAPSALPPVAQAPGAPVAQSARVGSTPAANASAHARAGWVHNGRGHSAVACPGRSETARARSDGCGECTGERSGAACAQRPPDRSLDARRRPRVGGRPR